MATRSGDMCGERGRRNRRRMRLDAKRSLVHFDSNLWDICIAMANSNLTSVLPLHGGAKSGTTQTSQVHHFEGHLQQVNDDAEAAHRGALYVATFAFQPYVLTRSSTSHIISLKMLRADVEFCGRPGCGPPTYNQTNRKERSTSIESDG